MKKLTDIVKSKFIQGASLPEWYEKRLTICNDCELNSQNMTNLTTSQRIWEKIANSYCTECGCTVVDKAKLEDMSCPKNYWGKIYTSNDKLALEQIGERYEFSYNSQIEQYVLNYGELSRGIDSKVVFRVQSGVDVVSINSSCGCTATQLRETESGYVFDISYNTNRKSGNFNQYVKIKYRSQGKEKINTIKVFGKLK